MKKEMVLDVMRELVGYTQPCGDFGIDRIRYENQEKIIYIVANAMEDLISNSKYKNRLDYYSINQIGNRAYEVLEELHKMIEDAL